MKKIPILADNNKVKICNYDVKLLHNFHLMYIMIVYFITKQIKDNLFPVMVLETHHI